MRKWINLFETRVAWNSEGKQRAIRIPPQFTTDGQEITFETGYNSVTAFVNNTEAGYADLRNRNADEYQIDLQGNRRLREPEWYVHRIWINEPFRRQGIATALYDFAYRTGFRPLRPSKSQTDGGKGVWAKRNQAHRAEGNQPIGWEPLK